MTLAEQCERNVEWWLDNHAAVSADSAAREKDHYGRVLWDTEYRAKWLLEQKLNRAAVRNMGLNRPTPPKKNPRSFVGGELALVGSDRVVSVPQTRIVNDRRIIHLRKGEDIAQKIARIGDAHDSPLPEHRPALASQLREYERETAEAAFLTHCEAETGMMMSEQELRKKRRAERLINTQSKAIADRLTRLGYDCYRHDGFRLFVYWLHSRALQELPSYRRVCIIPYIAAMTRAPKLAALEYFLQENPHSRFWTFTTGTRCTVDQLTDRMDWLFDNLKELNKVLNRRWGIEIVFRTTEFGSLECDEAGNRHGEDSWGELSKDADGRTLFHPHAHCVVLSKRGYIGKKWNDAIAYVNEYWQRDGKRIHWDAGNAIENPRECCKYVVKPNQYDAMSDADFLAFVTAIAKRRLVRPMGILAEEIRARREAGRILRRKRIGRRLIWAEELNHNRANAETEAEKAEIRNLQDSYSFTEDCERLANVDPPSYPGALDGGRLLDRGISADVTSVMARIGPAAGPTPWKEPRVIVMTNLDRPCLRYVDTHELVKQLRNRTVEHWEAGRAAAAPYRVHTGTLTGNEFQHDLPDLDPSPPPDTFLAPFLATNP